MKKFLSILLAMMLVLGMVVTANAAEGDTASTTTVTNNPQDKDMEVNVTIDSSTLISGHTFTAYQIFKGDEAGGVLSNVDWATGVNSSGLMEKLKEDATIGAKFTDAATAADVANVLKSFDYDSKEAKAFARLAEEHKGTGTTLSATNQMKPGYYLIVDTVPSSGAASDAVYNAALLQVAGSNITIKVKTDKPTHIKKVEENTKTVTGSEDSGYTLATKENDVADYCIGDSIPFALYSKVPNLDYFTHYEMVFHDTMSPGLTLTEGTVAVTVGGANLTSDEIEVSTGNDNTFTVKIKELVNKNYQKDAIIKVTFKATLNEKAVIGLPGNPNTSYLEYSNNPDDTTTKSQTAPDTVVVFTYELDVTKVDGQNATKLLKDAEFVLYKATNIYAKVDANGRLSGWTVNKDEATVLKSGEDGKFKVIGLDDGTYYLEETKAPSGYNELANPITVTIAATTDNDQNYAPEATKDNSLKELKVTVDNSAEAGNGNIDSGAVDITVKNNSGAVLPSTGGIGTTIFYILGSIMFIGAALALVVRRRADAEEV